MNAQGYANRYSQAQVTSVDHKRLLMLVFEGGLRFLRQAREALAADDLRRFGEALSRAQAIISELQATLDFERGGEISPSLNRLYDFMLLHLVDANVTRSVRHMEDVVRVFETIAGAYRAVIDGDAGASAA